MKRFLFSLLFIVCLFGGANAQFQDSDGQLVLSWGEPITGNPVSHYIITYKINPIAGQPRDSIITKVTPSIEDSTIVLLNKGDFAIAGVRAISVRSDTSIYMWTDTAYYWDPTGIGPPTNVMWKEN